MDEAGYMPISFVCSYIQCNGIDYGEIVKLLRENPMFDIDLPNETIRVKQNWAMVRIL